MHPFTQRRPSRATRLLPGLLLLFSAACGAPEDRATAGARVVDSAGVRLVENAGSVWTTQTAWTLDSVPLMRIGEGALADSALFDRVWDIETLSTGALAIIDGAEQQIRRYTADGSPLGVMGRRGSGPGEFASLWRLFRCASDTLIATDLRLRISVWDAAGQFVRELRDPPVARRPVKEVHGVSPDCGRALLLVREQIAAGVQVGRLTFRLLWSDWDANVVDSIITYAAIEVETVPFMGRSVPRAVPWSSAPVFAQRDSVVLFSDAAQPEYRLFDAQGAVQQIVRWRQEPRAVDDAERSRYETMRKRFLAESGEPPELLPPLSKRRVPELIPVASVALFDADGNVWLREYDTRDALPFAAEYDDRPRRWQVFDPLGTHLGRIDLPAQLKVMRIGRQQVVGVWRDEDDVQSVRAYGIRK